MVILQLQSDIIRFEGFESTITYLQQAGAILSFSDLDAFFKDAQNITVTIRQLEMYASEYFDMKIQAQELSSLDNVHVSELRATLLEEKMERKRLAGQLDVALQQVNHAKSALQSLRTDQIASDAMCQELKRDVDQLRHEAETHRVQYQEIVQSKEALERENNELRSRLAQIENELAS